MAADDQLERLLYILPVAARPEGARIDEIARALDVEPAEVLRDLEAAMTRAYYHPAGSVEPFTILIEGDVVRVHAPAEFQRPVRLDARECLALGLGLRALAASTDEPRRSEILTLAERLEAELATRGDLAVHGHLAEPAPEALDGQRAESAPDALDGERAESAPDALRTPAGQRALEADVEYEPEMALAFGDDGLRGVVADAIEQHRMLTLVYLKPGDTAPLARTVAPYRLVYAEGQWYVAAHDVAREGLRFFRLDRVLDAHVEPETPQPPLPDVDLDAILRRGAAYHAEEDVPTTVRYSGRVARWIVEQHGAAPEPDGSVVVEHSVADPGWIVRHVLRYGGEARVEAPAEVRRWVRQAATRMTVR